MKFWLKYQAKSFLLFTLLVLMELVGTKLHAQGFPGVGVGVGIPLPGVGIPINFLADYPNPYANKAPAYRSSYLYRSAELQALSNGEPTAIRSIYFDVAIQQGALLQNFTIRMKQVSWDEMPNPVPDDGFTTVYFPKTFVEKKGFNEHALDVPFCWDGVSNIVVDICVQNQAADKTYNATVRSNTPDSTKNTSYHDWNTTGNSICATSDMVQGAVYKKRPLTYFASIPAENTDLRQTQIIGPGELLEAGTTHPVVIELQNYSCPLVKGTKIGYQWNNDTPVIEDLGIDLVPGQKSVYTFSQQLSFIKAEFGVLKTWTQHPDDTYPANDSLVYLIFIKDETFVGLDYSGKEFWIAFMENYSNLNIDQRVFITSSKNTVAEVSVPLLNWSTSVNVPQNTVVGVTIPLTLEGVLTATAPSEQVSPTGVHVTATEDISVYGYSGIRLSTDGYLAVPRRTLGRDYTVFAPEGIYNPTLVPPLLINAPAEFIVVGTEDNTSIKIIPNKPTEKNLANDTIRAILNRGETFLVKARVEKTSLLGIDTYQSTYDLTGSRVIADKKVGLIGGSSCAYIPGITKADKCESCDHLLEMQTAPHTWGKTFYGSDFEFKPGDDIVRLVNGDADIAQVTVNGTTYTIARNSFQDVKFQGELFINSSIPIQALQMCTGGQCTLPSSSTDPFISSIVPESQWGNYYTFATPVTPDLSLHFINIVKKSSAGRIGFNGRILSSSLFKQIGSTDYYVAKVQVPVGVHKVSGDSILFVNVYGFGRDNSYGYPASGSLLKAINIDPPKITGISLNLKCFNDSTGSINVSAVGGTQPYSFHWNDGVTADERTGLAAGNYWVFVEDDYGYQDTAYFTLSQPDSLISTISKTDLTCNGLLNGTAQVNVSGGTKPYAYIWNTGATTAGITNLNAGKYSVKITDANNCPVNDTAIVTQPDPIKISIQPKMPSCFGSSDGELIAQITGGTTPYSLVWQNNVALKKDTLSNLSAGNYTIKVRDANACQADTLIYLAQPSKLSASFATTPITCYSSAGGSVKIKATGGSGNYSYKIDSDSWTKNDSLIGLHAGKHPISILDGVCLYNDTIQIDSIPSPVFNVSTAASRCDLPNGSASASASGGSGNYSFTWLTPSKQYGPAIYNQAAGSFILEATDGTCIQKLPYTIVGFKKPIFNVLTTPSTCGLDNGKALAQNIKATGTYSLNWFSNPIQNGDSAVNLAPGNYRVVLQDSLCSDFKLFSILKGNELKLSSIQKVNPECGKNNGLLKANVTGNTGPVMYIWHTDPPQFTQQINNLKSGNYLLEIRDKECSLFQNVSLADKNAPTISFTVTQPSCGLSNGEIVASINGGSGSYQLAWNGDSTINTLTYKNLQPGAYSLLVNDKGCLAGLDTLLIDLPAPQVQVNTSPATCNENNGKAYIKASGGTGTYTYYWNSTLGKDSLINIAPGAYQVSVDDGRCQTGAWFAILQTPAPQLQLISIDSASCMLANGRAKLTASGGTGNYQITWHTEPKQFGFEGINLPAGTTLATLFDGECYDSLSVLIPTIPLTTFNTTSSHEHCKTADGKLEVVAQNTASNTTIVWQDGNTLFKRVNLSAAWYIFVLNDGLCLYTDSIEIKNLAGPIITLDSLIPQHCGANNGEAFVSVISTEPYTINWNTSPAQQTLRATNLSSGNYAIRIKTAFCEDSISVNVPKIDSLTFKKQVTQNADCSLAQGAFELTPLSGSGTYYYTYSTIPNYSGNKPSNLSKGWYPFTVSDTYCTVTDSIEIKGTEGPLISDTLVGKAWCGKKNGFIKVVASSANGPVAFKWLNYANNTDSIGGLAPGNYTVELSDGICTNAYSFTIQAGKGPSAILDIDTDENCMQQNGSAHIHSLNPTTASITWFNNTTSSQIKQLSAGNYWATISDENCDTTLYFTIKNIPGPSLVLSALPDTCSAGVGAIKYSGINGTPPYKFFVNNELALFSSANGLVAKQYTILLSDAKNCQNRDTVQLSNVDLSMPYGRIISNELSPYPGDMLQLRTNLANDWIAQNWHCNDSLIGFGAKINYQTPFSEELLNMVVQTKHRLGCTDSIRIALNLVEDYTIYIPNCFTPEKDGYNELFFPVTTGISDLEGYVFNRWGEVIFQFKSLNDKWNGEYLSQVIKTDTYPFKMIFTTNKGKKITQFGKVTLLK